MAWLPRRIAPPRRDKFGGRGVTVARGPSAMTTDFTLLWKSRSCFCRSVNTCQSRLSRSCFLLLGERNRLPSHEGIPSCACNRKSGIIINRLAEILTWHHPVAIDRNINLATLYFALAIRRISVCFSLFFCTARVCVWHLCFFRASVYSIRCIEV